MQATFSDFLVGHVTGSSDNQTGFCMPYVDLIVCNMSDYGALEHYEQIFKRATQVGMQFKPSKCTFFLTHLEVLGNIVTPNGCIPDPKNGQLPNCCSEVSRNGSFFQAPHPKLCTKNLPPTRTFTKGQNVPVNCSG